MEMRIVSLSRMYDVTINVNRNFIDFAVVEI